MDFKTWQIHCEWGPNGLDAAADVVIIVDVLSFSTTVDIAVSRGAVVLPFATRDARAKEFARESKAELAGLRGESRYSLSPVSMLDIPRGTRVVLPSPNGATLSAFAHSEVVFAGCLRNAAAVARAAHASGGRILVLPAGERWHDGSLRPAIEDWLGAGAILDHLAGTFSPEAETARETFRAVKDSLARIIRESVSGQELIQRGYREDLELAVQLNVSESVPVLQDGAYCAQVP